jgi:hypothetical protein
MSVNVLIMVFRRRIGSVPIVDNHQLRCIRIIQREVMLLPIYKCPYCGAKIDPEGWGSYHGEYVGKASGKTYKYDKVSCGKCGRVVKEWK